VIASDTCRSFRKRFRHQAETIRMSAGWPMEKQWVRSRGGAPISTRSASTPRSCVVNHITSITKTSTAWTGRDLVGGFFAEDGRSTPRYDGEGCEGIQEMEAIQWGLGSSDGSAVFCSSGPGQPGR